MQFKTILLIFTIILGISFTPIAYSQQYIDIDLNPPKTKPAAPKQQPTTGTSKKPTPKPKSTTTKPAPRAVSKPAPKPAPKPTVSKPAPQPPVAKPSPTPPTPSPVAKPAAKPLKTLPKAQVKPAPKPVVAKPIPAVPTPPMPVPAPTPPAPIVTTPPTPPPEVTTPVPPPPQELSLDDPALQEATKPVRRADQKSQTFNTGEDESLKFKNRHGFTVDYSTFYETLKIKSKVTNGLMEGNSHYFGVSFNYDFTVYREKYGFAVTLGGITGNAQAGTKDSGDYYERRIAWTGFRGGGRLFYRANNRIDLGLGFMALSKSTKWPEEDSFSVLAQANPHYFYYLDTRWRLNYKYEIVQSFGAHLRSYALSWLLGVTYTLN